MLYIYFGKCEDGRYWLIWKTVIRYVQYLPTVKKTIIKTFCRIVDALRDKTLIKSLPKTVQQYIRQHAQELATTRGEKHATLTSRLSEIKQKLEKAIDTFDRVLLLLEKMPVTCLEKAIARMKVKERARISETLLDEAYEAKAVLEETVTLLEKLEQED